MQFLRQSTASQEILLGPFLDDTDGKTAETALSIANTDIKIWKTGATSEANKNSGGGTHVAGGRFSAVLDATDTDTIGPMEINVHVAGALPCKLRCCVLDEAVYDVLFGTVAPSTLAGVAQTGDSYAIVNSGTFGNSALKTLIDAVDNFVDTEIASLQSDVTAILADTNELQGGWAVVYDGINGWLNVNTFYIAGLTAQAEITARVQAALENNNLDHLVKSAVDTDFATTVHSNSVIGHLADNGSGFDRTTDSLETIRDAMATAANLSLVAINVNSVLTDTNELQTDWADGGRLDLILDARASQASVDTIDDLLDTEVAAIKSDTAAILVDTNELQTDWTDGGRLDAILDAIAADNPNRPARGVEFANLPFLMVDATDFATPETGITVTATISKDGGSFASCTNSVSEIGSGVYKITLTSTEMTADRIVLKFTGTGCAQRTVVIVTQPT